VSASAKTTGLILAASALILGSAVVTSIAAPPAVTAARVDDFQLADQNFVGRRLYKMKDAKAIVLISYAADDATSRADAKTWMALKNDYASRGVEFLMINSVIGETREKVLPAAKSAGIDMPILFDYEQLVGESLALNRAAEVVVIDPKTWTVAYRGPARSGSTKKALDSLVVGTPISLRAETAKGGKVDFPRASTAKKAEISYATDIAPIVQHKCTVCHQAGGLGPMALTSYEQIKAFAPMMREALRTKRMPPFQPDPTIGHWIPNEGLSSDQLRTLVHWIEAGAPRGEGEDPLAKVKFNAPKWVLGEPDLVLDLPIVNVPASGVMDYQRPVVKTNMKEGRWMRASAFLVSDRRALHHVTTGLRAPNASGAVVPMLDSKGSTGGQGPGRVYNLVPEDMGVWIPAGSEIAFETHYTPYGKETVEATKMGFYFYPEGQTPKYPMRTYGMYDMGITIPPGSEYHKEIVYQDIPQDMLVYGLTAHAHVRGGSTQVSIVFPDGKEKVIMAQPKYEFNWQGEFYLAEPLLVPAGSRIINRWTYDNSKRNFANPAPEKEVTFGQQSWDEMLTFFIHYRWVGETVAQPMDSLDRVMQAGHQMGVLDDNMDNKLQLTELRGQQAQFLKTNFASIDANKDGSLDKAEIAAGRRPTQAPAESGPPPG
jgi:hypothetical protein